MRTTQRSHSLTPKPTASASDARRVGAPDQPRQREAEAGKDREHGRQAEHAERQRPGELVGVDEKRRRRATTGRRRNSRSPTTSRRRTPPSATPSAWPPPSARSTAPSISHTASVIGAISAGAKSTGGMASAPAAPAAKAMPRRRQPQARITVWASPPGAAKRGRAASTKRGVFAHLSPGAAPDSGGVGSVRRARARPRCAGAARRAAGPSAA